MQTHLVPKIMHQNLAVILQQFNYGKNIFIVLVPGVNAAKPLGEEQTSASFCLFSFFSKITLAAKTGFELGSSD